MIHSLSKDQISMLPADQQEALGRLLLGKAAERRKLLAKAKGDRFFTLFTVISVIAAPALWAWTKDNTVVASMIAGWIFAHVLAVNSRIDSVVELLEYDRENGDSSPPPKQCISACPEDFSPPGIDEHRTGLSL